jgi:hypothetical protein
MTIETNHPSYYVNKTFTQFDVDEAIEAEREACARVCDVLSDKHGFEGCYANECAEAIRARGNT